MRPRATLPLLLALVLAVPAAAVDREPAPAPGCFDARAVREAVQSDAHTLAVRLDDQSRYRIDLASQCPGVLAHDDAQLVAPSGWACGRLTEAVRGGEQRCPLANVSSIDARQFSALALQARRDPDGVVLDRVRVQGARSRGFLGSHAYCLDVQQLRGWHEDGDGVVVEVAPMRSGGNRFYRVELGACQSLASSTTLVLKSGMGHGMVCGHAGDRAIFVSEASSAGAFSRPVSESSRVTRGGCAVMQVYPVGQDGMPAVAGLSPAR